MGESVAALGVRRIVRALADAARRWEHPDFPPRVRARAALEERTGFTAPVVEVALDRLMARLAADELERTIAGDLGTLDVLDGVARGPYGERAYAAPVGTVVVISASTTIGVGLWPAALALCCKNRVVLKEPADALGRGFFASVAEEEPLLRGAVRAASWHGGDAAIEDALFARADAVVAFGADETLLAIRGRLCPTTRFVGYGNAASAGIVRREALRDERTAALAADGAALDLSLYETTGCLSLHALFVEQGAAVSPERFTQLLAGALERRTVELPVGRRAVSEQAAIRGARELAAFRAASGHGAVYAPRDLAWTLLLDPPADESPAFLPRTLTITRVSSAHEAALRMAALHLPVETLAAAPPPGDDADAALLAQLAARIGAARVCALGAMQDPRLAGHHGARPRVADLVHWIDLEP